MPLPPLDTSYMIKFLVDLLNTPSPTGHAEPGIAFIEKELSNYNFLTLSHLLHPPCPL